jgi:CO/xanthine dehydrogenase FAD-binding subunit
MYLRPTDLNDALMALESRPLTILAGGTDFYPQRAGQPLKADVLDITALAGLRGIEAGGGGLSLGALTTWSDVLEAHLPPWLSGLKQAAREVGGVQIQNAGTVAGNICNASPAADGVPALLAVDAEVELACREGVRRMPLQEFIVGSRRTQRRAGELLTRIFIPDRSTQAHSVFLKLGARRYLVISIAMVAAMLDCDADGMITYAAVALGACSEVAQRLPRLEAALIGQRVTPALAQAVLPAHLAGLKPISDIRGTAQYRTDVALTLVRRALTELALD